LGKLELFGHIARIDISRNIKSVVMGMMDGDTRKGRPKWERLDDIKDWCQKDAQSSPNQTSLRMKQTEAGGEMFVGHLLPMDHDNNDHISGYIQ